MLVQSSMAQGITIKVKLDLQHIEDVSKIIYTMEQYRQACNYISEYIFTHGFQLNQLKLHKEIYNNIRVRFGLKSMMAQSAIRSTIARYKAVNTQLKQNPYRFQDVNTKKWYRVSKNLEWLEKPISFVRPQVDLVRNRDWSKLANGIRFHAVCYDEQGKTIFFSGSKAKTKHNKFAKVRAEYVRTREPLDDRC